MPNDIFEKLCNPSSGLAPFECEPLELAFMFMLNPPIDTGRLLGCARANEAVDVGEKALSAVRFDEGRCCGGCW